MLSRSFELPEELEDDVSDASRLQPSVGAGSIQHDVERLIQIAAHLYSAIERQIHHMEEELVLACGEQVRSYAETVFKERLIHCAESLGTSLQEIAFNLEHREINWPAPHILQNNSPI